MYPSHNCSRAKLVFDEITLTGVDTCETWVAFFPRAATPYYDLVQEVKNELNESQQMKYAGRHGWSSPFVWLEQPDGSRQAIGGRDEFCQWACETFPNNQKIREWAAGEPPSSESTSVDVSKAGNAPLSTPVPQHV